MLLLISYAGVLSNPQAPQRKTLSKIGYSPTLWNVQQDAETNGALTTFLSLTRVKAMEDEPEYSQAAMQQIKNRMHSRRRDQRAAFAESHGQHGRHDPLGKLLRSEPRAERALRRRPDAEHPRAWPDHHFGPHALPGYGGGTANIEFQQMTGLNMANFSDTLLSPYQQLVATRPKFYSFNQM